jgi:hypothetical protein
VREKSNVNVGREGAKNVWVNTMAYGGFGIRTVNLLDLLPQAYEILFLCGRYQ